MKPLKLLIFLSAICLLRIDILFAQTLPPDWAKQIYGSKGGSATYTNIAADRHGNIYAVYLDKGYVDAGGQTTPDSTVTSVLVSWDCNGNLRWMKSLGATGSNSATNYGMYVETDTLDGIYVSGQCTIPNVSANLYWDTDTSLNVAAGDRVVYLLKYNSQGQFQWLRTPSHNNKSDFYNELSVSPSGEVFWFALLDTGTYNSGAFAISVRKYYAAQYDAAGSFQSITPLDMTPPVSATTFFKVSWKFDPASNRFYNWLSYGTSYGNLVIGNTIVAPPTGSSQGTAVLSAFNRQGQNIWVKQANTVKNSDIHDIAFGKDGTLFLRGSSEPGTIFCGDTATNTLGQNYSSFIMALDSNANLFWSNHSSNTHSLGALFSNAGFNNNTLVAIGQYYGTLTWDNYTLTNAGQTYNAYMLKVDAGTGTAQQLSAFSASTLCNPTGSVVDNNGNVYISGVFQGNMNFGTNSFSSVPSWNSNHFLLKFKNVTCGCNLLQPAFNVSSSGTSTYQFTYTGGSPYTAISWDFGDGTPSVSGSNPSHTFTSLGTFPVCVTVTNSCGSNTHCKHLILSSTDIGDAGNVFRSVNVYPVPARDKVMINGLPPGITLEVLNVMGRCVKKVRTDKAEINISIADLSSGIYMLRLTSKDGFSTVRRFSKE